MKYKYNWNNFIKKEKKECYFKNLIFFLKTEYKKFSCYPIKKNIFSAFKHCSFSDVKVVLLGQDPYFNKNQADGLCFSVIKGASIPPSLRNIFTEIKSCYHYTPKCGSLIKWAKQGVLLLNSILTVREGISRSHKNKGWEIFTNKVVNYISTNKYNIIFLLWGLDAKKKITYIYPNRGHLILMTSHPSPFSANLGFFGSRHFIITNKFLLKNGNKQIYW